MANRKENDELLAKVLSSHDSTMQELNFINTVFSFLNRKTKYLQQNNATSQIQAIVSKHVEKAKQKELAAKEKRAKKKAKKNKSKVSATKTATKTTTTTTNTTTNDNIKTENKNENENIENGGTNGIAVGTDDIVTQNNEKNENNNSNDVKEDSENEEDDGSKLIGNGGTTDKYVWTQTLEEVEMKINVPKNTVGKDCIVKFSDKHLSVSLKNNNNSNNSEYIINGELHDLVDSEDCTWTLDSEYGKESKTLTIFLNKHKGMNWWSRVIIGDKEIDTKKIEPANSKLDDLEPDVRQTVEKMMYDQRAKMTGKPTSKELEQQKILEKFKSQHPEMDFSNVKFG